MSLNHKDGFQEFSQNQTSKKNCVKTKTSVGLLSNFVLKKSKSSSDTKNMEKNKPTDTEFIDSESPYKNVLRTKAQLTLNDSTDSADFRSPCPTRKQNKAPKNHKKNTIRKNEPKRKATSKQRQISKSAANVFEKNTLVDVIEDNYKHFGVNMEHMQMAMALSKSSYELERSSGSQSPDNELVPDIGEILRNSKPSLLERFGFTAKRRVIDGKKILGKPVLQVNSKSRRRFKYITPILNIRTNTERNELIASKISLILCQKSEKVKKSSELIIHSNLLPNYMRYQKSIFNVDGIYEDNIFYVRSLDIDHSYYKCGSLLKNWHSIPGRDISPVRTLDNRENECKEHPFGENNLDTDDYEVNPHDFVERIILSTSQELYGEKVVNNKDTISQHQESANRDDNLSIRSISPDLFASDNETTFEQQKSDNNLENCELNDIVDLTNEDETENTSSPKTSPTKNKRNDIDFLYEMNKKSIAKNVNFYSLEEFEGAESNSSSELYGDGNNGIKTKSESKEEIYEYCGFKQEKSIVQSIDTSNVFPLGSRPSSIIKVNSCSNIISVQQVPNQWEINNIDNLYSSRSHSENKRSQNNCNSPNDVPNDSSFIANDDNMDNDERNSPNNIPNDSSFIANYDNDERYQNGSPSKLDPLVHENQVPTRNHSSMSYFSPHGPRNENNELLVPSTTCYSLEETPKRYCKDMYCKSPDVNKPDLYNCTNLNVTEYVNNILNCDSMEKNIRDKDIMEDNEDEQSSQCTVMDEELNYSSHFSTPAKFCRFKEENIEIDLSDNGLSTDVDADNVENYAVTKNVIIKTKNVTPMPNYENMATPQIKNELQKLGVKPLKRARGAKLLKFIYESTHPVVDSKESCISDNFEQDEDNRIVKRRKCSGQGMVENSSSQFTDKIQYADNKEASIELIGDKITENENVEELIFERKFSVKISSCKIPLHIVWHNFISSNPEIKRNILLYEPLQLESLHSMLKAQGFKFHLQDLITFLDKKCITIRMAQNQGKSTNKL